MEYVWVSQPSGNSYSAINANWTVPLAPLVPLQVYYSFPGLQSNSYIIQPVLQYNYTGPSWTLGSWHCNSGSDCIHSSFIGTDTGHGIYAYYYGPYGGTGSTHLTLAVTDSLGAQRSASRQVFITSSYTYCS
ncbi:MAG: hypothetical protein DMF85_01360 [Acidobacteria bacterium]|nr:MAG: hypothetical protein DMF85_01360 [Acidobacteriota bacterium]